MYFATDNLCELYQGLSAIPVKEVTTNPDLTRIFQKLRAISYIFLNILLASSFSSFENEIAQNSEYETTDTTSNSDSLSETRPYPNSLSDCLSTSSAKTKQFEEPDKELDKELSTSQPFSQCIESLEDLEYFDKLIVKEGSFSGLLMVYDGMYIGNLQTTFTPLEELLTVEEENLKTAHEKITKSSSFTNSFYPFYGYQYQPWQFQPKKTYGFKTDKPYPKNKIKFGHKRDGAKNNNWSSQKENNQLKSNQMY